MLETISLTFHQFVQNISSISQKLFFVRLDSRSSNDENVFDTSITQSYEAHTLKKQ
jgi:hypothetical protein